MTDLIARLEAATEGGRELDAEIRFVVDKPLTADDRPGMFYWNNGQVWLGKELWIGSAMAPVSNTPRYTESIDAALTLVPEGWSWSLYSDGSGEIYKDVPSGMLPGAPGSTVIDVEAATPALALCIAAIRAMGDG